MKYPLLFLILGLAGCVVTDVGNPQTHTPQKTETPLKLVAYDSSVNANLANALTLAIGLEVTHAWVSIDELQAKACDVDGVEPLDVTFAPFFVDLISGQAYPEPIKFASESTFCELSMEFKPAEGVLPSGVPADMQGLSVMVRAIRKDGTPVQVFGDFSETLRLRGAVDLRDMDSLFVGFAANEWFDEEVQTLSAEDGLVVVDPNTNTDSYDVFRESFKNSSRLFRDEDRDGELDDDEDDNALAEHEEEDEEEVQ